MVPGPGQESVWDYPRPPRIERVEAEVRVECAGVAVARSRRALRVLETASPPTYYVHPADVRCDLLELDDAETFCEWKGAARYWSLEVEGQRVAQAAWSYASPDEGFAAIRDHFAFHAGRVGGCFVGGVRVEPQPGEYYGGWVTPDLVGPFKGEPGSEGW